MTPLVTQTVTPEVGVAHLNDTTFNAILYHELDRLDGSSLAKTMDTVHGLCGACQETLSNSSSSDLRYST